MSARWCQDSTVLQDWWDSEPLTKSILARFQYIMNGPDSKRMRCRAFSQWSKNPSTALMRLAKAHALSANHTRSLKQRGLHRNPYNHHAHDGKTGQSSQEPSGRAWGCTACTATSELRCPGQAT